MMINSIYYDKHVHYGMLRKLISTGAIFQYAKMILVGGAKNLLFFILYPKALNSKEYCFCPFVGLLK